MLQAAQKAGVVIHGETAVTSYAPEGDGFLVTTARGQVKARSMIMATNGYTDGVDKWLRRRLVPVRSRIIATAPLSGNLMKQLMPKGVMAGDTRRLHYYYRPSPDGTRILYGGRDGNVAGEGEGATRLLTRGLAQVFPILADVELTHSWFGYVAMNRDMFPRVFHRNGAGYAVGYCGSGVVWAPWAGKKAALQLIDADAGRTVLLVRQPRSRCTTWHPWFIPGVFCGMRLRPARSAAARSQLGIGAPNSPTAERPPPACFCNSCASGAIPFEMPIARPPAGEVRTSKRRSAPRDRTRSVIGDAGTAHPVELAARARRRYRPA
jgi:hypothetical protein